MQETHYQTHTHRLNHQHTISSPSHHPPHSFCTHQIHRRVALCLCGPHRHSSRRRFWCILLIFAIASYLMCIANVLTELRWRNTNPTILPDLGFAFANTLTPQLTSNTAWRRVPDLSVNIALGVTALWLIADGPRKAKLAVLRRFLAAVVRPCAVCVGHAVARSLHRCDVHSRCR